MEEKYRLQELQTDGIFTNKKVRYLLLIIWLIGTILLSVCIFFVTKSILALLIIAFGYSCIFGIIALSLYLFPKNNKEYEYIKNIGKKDTAYIVDTGFSQYGHRAHIRNGIVSIAISTIFFIFCI